MRSTKKLVWNIVVGFSLTASPALAGAEQTHIIQLGNNYTVTRDGDLGDNVDWVIEVNGKQALARNARGELFFRYASINQLALTPGASVTTYLRGFADGLGYQPVSNKVKYTFEPSYRLEISPDKTIVGAGHKHKRDTVHWVVSQKGIPVFTQEADKTLSLQYDFSPGATYWIHLERVIDGEVKIASNIVRYTLPEDNEYMPNTIKIEEDFRIIKTSNSGARGYWVVLEDGEEVSRIFTESAPAKNEEIQHNNKNGKFYQVYIVEWTGRFYERASNIVEYHAVIASDLPDYDGDGVPVNKDNCIGVKNPTQQDSDNDGFGNLCDPDLDNNGLVDRNDKKVFMTFRRAKNLAGDLNEDGKVDAYDYRILRSAVKSRKTPGPSAFIQ